MNLRIFSFLMAFIITEAARILGVYPFPGYSHFQLGDIIFKELAKRGHDVTVISPFQEKELVDNFKQVLVNGMSERTVETKNELFNILEYNILQKVMWMDTLGYNFSELALNSSNVQKFLNESNTFDLVIVHHFMNDAFNGFCHKYKAPCIAICSMGHTSWFNDKFGLSAPPSYVPELLLSYSSSMNFWERLHNVMVYVLVTLSHHLYRYPNQRRLLKTYFPDAPDLDDLYYNTSLILFNGHVSVSSVAPTLPNTIDIAGYHVKPPKKLPDDLHEHLDNATDGVIYFSMGSNLKSKDFTADTRNAILNVFSELKQKVFWKWEEDYLPHKPDNILIRSWFPQQDILAHPNVILFITHGGLLGTIEAVYYGKPVLALPVFADQSINAARAQRDGYGRYILCEKLNEDNFRNEIHELLSNPEYAANAKYRSNVMHDQPLPPLEKAIFWIEYVLRHKGAPHLRSSALSLKWYQYFLLDILCVIGTCFVLTLFLITSVIKKIYLLYNGNNNKNKVKME